MKMGRHQSPPGGDAIPLVRGIVELGPRDLKRVASLTGLSYERANRTLKRAKEQFGIRIIGSPNLSALGLVTGFYTAELSPENRKHGMKALRELPSLESVATDPANLSRLFGLIYLPANQAGVTYESLFRRLMDAGFLERYTLERYSKRRRYSLIPEFIDWETGKYSFSWDSLPERAAEETPTELQECAGDLIDILILKELESDAAVPLVELSKRLEKLHAVKITDRGLYHHLLHHVSQRKLLSRYRVFMPFGSTFQIGVRLTGKDEEAAEKIRRVPFLNMELLEGEKRLAWLNVPPAEKANLIRYLYDNVFGHTMAVESFVSLPALRETFTIPYELYNSELGGWSFEPEIHAERVLAKAKELKESVPRIT